MIIGMVGLATAFLIIVTLLTLMVIKQELKWYLMVPTIVCSIWFSAGMYFIPSSFTGFSKKLESVDELPNRSVVEKILIKEGHEIIFLMTPLELEAPVGWTDPRVFFNVRIDGETFLYAVPYSKELHERLVSLMTAAEENGGILIWDSSDAWKKPKDGEANESDVNKRSGTDGFQILNPRQFLLKEDIPE